jgi:hypothetical protein
MVIYRSHRVFGIEIARTTADNGQEFVVLKTGPNREEVSLAHMLMPVSEQELNARVMLGLMEVLEQAAFFGLEKDKIREVFDRALEQMEKS